MLRFIYFAALLLTACSSPSENSLNYNSSEEYDALVVEMTENYWRGRHTKVIDAAEIASKYVLNEMPTFEHHLFSTVESLRDGELEIAAERLENFETVLLVLRGKRSCQNDDFARKALANFSLSEFEIDVCAEIYFGYYEAGEFLSNSHYMDLKNVVEDMRESVERLQ